MCGAGTARTRPRRGRQPSKQTGRQTPLGLPANGRGRNTLEASQARRPFSLCSAPSLGSSISFHRRFLPHLHTEGTLSMGKYDRPCQVQAIGHTQSAPSSRPRARAWGLTAPLLQPRRVPGENCQRPYPSTRKVLAQKQCLYRRSDETRSGREECCGTEPANTHEDARKHGARPRTAAPRHSTGRRASRRVTGCCLWVWALGMVSFLLSKLHIWTQAAFHRDVPGS